jgi:hypothetical protein
MKLCQKIFGISVLALAATACDEASKSNPATAARDDLNPPTGLVSLTGDTTVTLRWLGNNTEDDFKGYHVFMAEGDFSGKTGGTAWTATYPKGANLETGSVPRCKDNNTLFTNFKFPESTNDCEGDTATDSGTPTGTMALAEDEEAPLPFAKCDGKSDENLSVPVTDKVLGMQECKITGLTNGKTYTFVVMAVMGADFDNISWSSNMVADTPANALFSGELTFPAVTASGVTPAKKAHIFLAHADIVSAMTGTDLTSDNWKVVETCANDFCSIASTTGNLQSNPAGIYLGRFGGSKPARIFFSAPGKTDSDSDGIMYLYRGGQTYDPANPTVVATTIPGDQANTDTDNNYTNATLVDVLGNEVIDIAVQNNGKWHFGKLVIDAPTLATAGDATSEIKVKVTLIVQPTAGNPHYLQ